MIRAFNLTVWRSKRFESLFLGFVALIFVPFVIAQDSAPTGPAIRVTSRHVEVAVIVQDDHGEPITGLTKDDFELFDQGRPQSIADFSVLSELQTTTSSTQAPATPEPGNSFSNRASTGTEASPRVSVILLDSTNSASLNLQWARGKVIKFLEGMRPQDSVAIYSLSEDLVVLHGFTNDANALIASLSKSSNPQSRLKTESVAESNDSVDAGNGRDARDQLEGAEMRRVGAVVTARAVTTPAALVAIAHNLAGIKGRKSLIWISSAFPAFVDWRSGGPPASNRGTTLRSQR